jgi:RNA polymerase sigma-70 factor, ECF subfamily
MDDFTFDDEYVRRLLAGDPAVERHFFRYFHGRLRTKFVKGVHPPSEADDLCQRVFLIAFAALSGGKGPEDGRKLPAWMFGIARNLLSEWYRAPKSDQFDPATHDVPSREDVELTYITLERIELVRQVIEWLDPPSRDRDIVKAIYIEERDRKEVCRDHGVDQQYLRVLVHRALKRFAELFQKDK